ncbi:MAG: GNAT family N-acetyltransferase [Bacteroidales bacterium]|nr:GNAT family N-acetyltransferase [Bacteroidales bacterium]MCB9012999.1 GNAT family N-acetyltransferase [Bacteroidales bacterium]
MVEIIPPVPKSLIEAELTEDKFIRKTNKAENHLYIVTHHDSPNIMQEIGRLREVTFRAAGGGTGLAVDIDEFDTNDNPYKQLIVWDPSEKEILGGYRFHLCDDLTFNEHGEAEIATTELFNFSEKFIRDYVPHMIELGRSFVQPHYQSTNNLSKALYALDNLWDGLGSLIIDYPEKKYFFGKVTMYQNYNQRARNNLLYFLEKHFPDTENLVSPKFPLDTKMNREELAKVYTGSTFMEDYKILSQTVRAFGENIPPLINAYMNLSPSLKTFGTALNPYFGDVEETAIMITINDLYHQKVERHVSSYDPDDKP